MTTPVISVSALSSSSLRVNITTQSTISFSSTGAANPGATAITGYSIERSLDGSTGWAVVTLLTSGTQYDDTGLSASTAYYYRARAYDNAPLTNYSAYSTTQNATTDAGGATFFGSTLPTQPQLLVDVSYSLPTGGTTHVVTNSAELNTALSAAVGGDVIQMQAGVTYNPITLPNKAGSSYIYIISSALGSLPAFTGKYTGAGRVSRSDLSNMPIIQGVGANGGALAVANGAHHFRFVGIAFQKQPGVFFQSAVCSVSSGSSNNADMPHHIIFDRCLVIGEQGVSNETLRGIAISGSHIGVVQCHIDEMKFTGADSQAVWGYQGDGPVCIANNYLEGCGENVMFGGADPAITNSLIRDIEIVNNHFYKQPGWRTASYTLKNLLEFKNAERVLVANNHFENTWSHGQATALVMTVRNQDGSASWCSVNDLTIVQNRFTNVVRVMSGHATDNNWGSQHTTRFLFRDNVAQITGLSQTGFYSKAAPFEFSTPIPDAIIDHNTLMLTDAVIAAAAGSGAYYVYTGDMWVGPGFNVNTPDANANPRWVHTNNIVHNGLYGYFSDGTNSPGGTIEARNTTFTFNGNVVVAGAGTIAGRSGNAYPATKSTIQFTDEANENYTLQGTSPYLTTATDGGPSGARMNLVAPAGGGGYTGGYTP